MTLTFTLWLPFLVKWAMQPPVTPIKKFATVRPGLGFGRGRAVKLAPTTAWPTSPRTVSQSVQVKLEVNRMHREQCFIIYVTETVVQTLTHFDRRRPLLIQRFNK